MNDHNLDDLIIDNVNPKHAKRKSLLTIIALAIVLLVVAIILTKTLFKEPNLELDIQDESNVEMISSDLTLQNTTKNDDTQKDLTEEKASLHEKSDLKTKSSTIEETLAESETLSKSLEAKAKTKSSTIEETLAESETLSKSLEEKKKTLSKVIAEKTKTKTIEISEDIFDDDVKENIKNDTIKQTQEKTHKPKITITEKTQPSRKSKTISTTSQRNGRYFIQVGSFKLSPSKQFLSIIKKSGFNYRITPSSSSGTKRLLIGPYSSRTSVNSALPRVRDRINKGAFVVKK